MKSKLLRFVCVFIAAILVALSGIAVNAYTAEALPEALRQQILEYKLSAEDAADEQDFINGWIAENAGEGSADWYALCLARSGSYDFSAYTSVIDERINASGLKATDRQRMALAYIATGGTNLNIGWVIDDTWNKLGVMSEIYALILMNSGSFDTAVCDDDIVRSMLERQHDDGGWSLSGNFSDPDVTAMALQALAPYKGNDGVNTRIEKAVSLLSDMQQPDGGYKSYGTANAESCAQVVIALCQLGINPQNDGRFLKNGNSPVDGLLMYQLDSGGFSHLSGSSENGIATVQAVEAFTALSNGSLYELKNADIDFEVPLSPEESVTPTEPVVTDKTDPVTTKPPAEVKPSGTATVTVTTTAGNAQKPTEPQPNNSAGDSQGIQAEIVPETTEAVSTEITSNTEASATQTVTTVSSKSISATAAESSETSVCHSSAGSTSTIAAVPIDEDSSGSDNSGGESWKLWAYATIAGILVVSQIYVIVRKQFSWKSAAVSAAVCSAFAGVVFLMDIQTPEEYYSRNISDVQPDSLTVTMSVSCETIKDELSGDYMIIPETEFALLEGETAFDLLERVLAYHKIPFDYNGNIGTDIYIRGIDNIYEMDYGEMSGWMYRVNGDFPDTGCGAFTLEDGDTVEWIYTREIGRDIGQEEYAE